MGSAIVGSILGARDMSYRVSRVIDRILRPIGRGVLKWVHLPIPEWHLKQPLADYGFVADCFEKHNLGDVEGDLLEIGVWVGFGTVKMAELAKKFDKTVHASDGFRTHFGKPETLTSVSARRYARLCAGLSQREVFDRNTAGFSNIVVHDGEHSSFELPATVTLCCSVIDGSHDYEDVQKYLAISWKHLNSGGIVILNDYQNPETPELTMAGDEFVQEYEAEIDYVDAYLPRRMLVFRKASRK